MAAVYFLPFAKPTPTKKGLAELPKVRIASLERPHDLRTQIVAAPEPHS